MAVFLRAQTNKPNTAIMAVDLEGGMGLDNSLPWGGNKGDLAWFKDFRLHHDLLMGLSTFDNTPLKGKVKVKVIHELKGRMALLERELTNQNNFSPAVIAGGAKIYEHYYPDIELLFLTIIPKVHKADKLMNLDKWFKEGWRVFQTGGLKDKGLNSDYCYLVVLTKNHVVPDSQQLSLIDKHFEPYLKLTVKDNLTIAPGAKGIVRTNEIIAVPHNSTGVFSPRLKLAKSGIFTSANNFKANWIGNSFIVVTNKSLEPLELYAGEEIGEMAFLLNAWRAL